MGNLVESPWFTLIILIIYVILQIIMLDINILLIMPPVSPQRTMCKTYLFTNNLILWRCLGPGGESPFTDINGNIWFAYHEWKCPDGKLIHIFLSFFCFSNLNCTHVRIISKQSKIYTY